MATIYALRAGRWVTTQVPLANWQETVCTILEDPLVQQYRVEDENRTVLEWARVARTNRF